MSLVTSVTIITRHASPKFVTAVTAPHRFRARDDSGWDDQFRQISTGGAGGTKTHSHDIFAAGLNYCEREWLREWADRLPWYDWGVVLVDTESVHPEMWVYGDMSPQLTT